jgi:hypothetical protein
MACLPVSPRAQKTSTILVRGHKGKKQKAGVQVSSGSRAKNHFDVMFSSRIFNTNPLLYVILVYNACLPVMVSCQ